MRLALFGMQTDFFYQAGKDENWLKPGSSAGPVGYEGNFNGIEGAIVDSVQIIHVLRQGRLYYISGGFYHHLYSFLGRVSRLL